MEENGVSPLALFIGNNTFPLRRIMATLAEAGFNTSHAREWNGGLSLLCEKPWDLLFVERVILPMHWRDACVQLRAATAAPVVLLGREREDHPSVQEALLAGIDNYLKMSTPATELVARSRALLRRSIERKGKG